MAHPAPTQLVPVAAREARSALLAALGTENNPSQWMLFMKAVTTHLPDVLSSGRPSAADIRNSVIGLYGFKSWRQMIETDISDGGFGWNYSTWKAWRRAWSVVDAMPWLRDERVTYSEVIQLSLKLKAASQTDNPPSPPENMAEATAIVAQVKEARASKPDFDISNHNHDRVRREILIRRYRDLHTRKRRIAKQCSDLAVEVREQGDRAQKLERALIQARRQLQTARDQVDEYQGMTLWQRVKAVWLGY